MTRTETSKNWNEKTAVKVDRTREMPRTKHTTNKRPKNDSWYTV